MTIEMIQTPAAPAIQAITPEELQSSVEKLSLLFHEKEHRRRLSLTAKERKNEIDAFRLKAFPALGDVLHQYVYIAEFGNAEQLEDWAYRAADRLINTNRRKAVRRTLEMAIHVLTLSRKYRGQRDAFCRIRDEIISMGYFVL